MKRTIFIVIVALVALVGVSGCSGVVNDEAPAPVKIKMVLITDPASAVDAQYNSQLEIAVKNACSQYGKRLTAETVQLPGSGIDRKAYIDEQLRSGQYDVVIDSDLYYTRNVVELADKYPRVKFIIVDESIAAVGKNSNLLLISYNAFQEGFIAGYSAGLKAKTTVAIIALKNNPNSYRLIKGFKAGILYANKALKIIKKDVELERYNVGTVFANEQKFRNDVFNSAQQAVSEGADVVIPESMIPAVPVLAAVQNTPVLVVATETEYEILKNNTNYLSCIIEEYDYGVTQAIARIMSSNFAGGTLEMNFFNEGLKFRSPDKVNEAACNKLINELIGNPKFIVTMEGVQ